MGGTQATGIALDSECLKVLDQAKRRMEEEHGVPINRSALVRRAILIVYGSKKKTPRARS